MKKAIISWSGGKDSALALFFCRQAGEYDVVGLLTNVNTEWNRVSMHGVRAELIEAQAWAIGLPLFRLNLPGDVSMDAYNSLTKNRLSELKAHGITHVIYGDIFLEDLRRYREQQLREIGLEAVFPLWHQPTNDVLQTFTAAGFKAVIVCVNENRLPAAWAGRELDATIVLELPPTVDACGENGEYHSFVYDGPIFKKPVAFRKGDHVSRSYDSSEHWDTRFIFQDLWSPA
ncbi:diphthine--ammonia ligase [Larkinella bovis]|uniref:Diphthine--ammonia ligase n=1 Tax=Larkinella bovis TaxID=683041 RepID=A0ABW0I4M4_9BACT